MIRYDVPDELVELHYWWMNTAHNDFMMMVPKLSEYGAFDLKIIGAQIAHLSKIEQIAVGEELACWFYASGKCARLEADYEKGLPGKDDTWMDLTIYSFMARRIKASGGWPGLQDSSTSQVRLTGFPEK